MQKQLMFGRTNILFNLLPEKKLNISRKALHRISIYRNLTSTNVKALHFTNERVREY